MVVFACMGLMQSLIDTKGGIRDACRQYDGDNDVLYH